MGRRLVWIGAILLSAMLYLFENNAGTLTLLVSVLVVPALGLLPLAGKRIQAEVGLFGTQEKGMRAKGTLTVINPGLLPQPRVCFTLFCRNLHTGETTESTLELGLLPRQKKQIDFSFACPHCGKIELRLANARTADVFGLLERGFSCEIRKEFPVMPRMFAPAISLERSDMAMPDSDTYSPWKPGSDPGETFAIREYIPGDAVRNIHWKLSEKTGKTMVREFGLPVVDEVAILLETAGILSAEETDAVTEVFASVSAQLAEMGISHDAFWRDFETDELRMHAVRDEDDFSAMLEALLELPPKAEGDVAGRFLEEYPHCPYSHVILVGGRIPASACDLYNGNRVSILLPRRGGVSEGLQGDGTHVLTFEPDSYGVDLCRMEV